MRTIAIVLGDNNFRHTFEPILESLKQVLIYHAGPGDLPEEFIKKVILEGIRFHYLAYQVGVDTKGRAETEAEVQIILNDISKIKILFDSEAEADICGSYGHDGGAWCLDLQSNQIHSY